MDARMLQYLKFLCGSCLLKAHAPGYESLHFSSSLFSLAFTWERTCVCAWPCTHTSTHPSLPHKTFTVIMMEIARAWSEGSRWIKEPRRSDKEDAVPSALTPHLITISLWCIFMTMLNLITVVFAVKRLFRKRGTRRQTRTVPRAAFASVRPWKCSRSGPKERRADELLWSCICVNCKASSARTPVLSETRALAPRVCSSRVKTAPTLTVCKRV